MINKPARRNAKARDRDPILVAIGIFRYAKALLLIASGLGVLRLIRPGAAAAAAQWVSQMPFAEQHAFVQRALAEVTRMPPRRFEEIAAGAFAYAALFVVEGTGLILGRVWAEWLTIVATVSFIPFEVIEAAKKPTPLRIGIVAANVAIVIYLVWKRVRARR